MSIQQQIDSILSRKLRERVDNSLDDKTLNKIGLETKRQIIKRTRLGKGVKYRGGPTFKLADLQDSTIDTRERYESNLSPFTRPQRSNLTATGQMLDSIDYKILKSSNIKTVEIFFKDNRKFELSGSRSKIQNKDIAKIVAKNGRPFFNLSGFEIAKIRSIIFQAFE